MSGSTQVPFGAYQAIQQAPILEHAKKETINHIEGINPFHQVKVTNAVLCLKACGFEIIDYSVDENKNVEIQAVVKPSIDPFDLAIIRRDAPKFKGYVHQEASKYLIYLKDFQAKRLPMKANPLLLTVSPEISDMEKELLRSGKF